MIEIRRYYSQGGEDSLIMEFFDFKTEGYYVDIGAFDGVHLSNSLTFEQQGWDGICVEANPKYAELCEKSRTNAKCIQAACSSKIGENILLHTDELGLLSSIERSDDKTEDIKRRYANRGLEFNDLNEISVPVTTVDQILKDEYCKDIKVIDFISIDVEGHEMEVLKGMDIKLWKPRIILIEANSGEEENEIKEYLVGKMGYILSRKVGVNLFFVRNGDDSEKLQNIKIKCVIEKQMHPLGAAYTPVEYLEGKVINEVLDLFIAEQKQIINRNNRAIKQLKESINDKIECISSIKSTTRYKLINFVFYPLDKLRSLAYQNKK